MKCYYHHTQCHFLDYFNDPILDDAVFYTSDIPFQYNKIEGGYTEFIGNLIGTVFIATKKDHEFLLSQRSKKPTLSSNSINFGPLNINKIQVTPANTSYWPQYTHHA